MKSTFYSIYAYLFSKKIFYKFNKLLIILGSRGIGINNYYNLSVSGEKYFIKALKENYNLKVVFDVGANVGDYTECFSQSNIYSFEPNPSVYEQLAKRFKDNKNVKVFNIGFSDEIGDLTLYVDKNALKNSSIHKNVFDNIDTKQIVEINVKLDTIDNFIKNNQIDQISFLKIDTEGNEYKVLKGASESIANNKIDIIQFEFGMPNVASRVFLKDIRELLSNYTLYRLLPFSSIPLSDIDEMMFLEIFEFQNIIAIRKDVKFKF